MLSTILASARANPRTTLAGIASALAMLGGILGTLQTGQTWPIVAGVICSKLADVITSALAADSKGAA